MTQIAIDTDTSSDATGSDADCANRLAQSSSTDAKGANRCTFRFPNGSRCRLSVLDTSARLCFGHAKLQLEQRDMADLSADLLGGQPAEFKTPEQINDLLSKVVLLLAQSRISPRRAAVITYACSLLLRSVVVMDRQSSEDGPRIIFDLPRPSGSSCEQDDDLYPVPQPEMANRPCT